MDDDYSVAESILQGETFDDKLDSIASLLASKKNIIALVGAGISVSAGIPDFRSATGLYNTLNHQVSV
jgi:NAD-dependent histone deacetylase SIR2